jgi:hypothetical protein
MSFQSCVFSYSRILKILRIKRALVHSNIVWYHTMRYLLEHLYQIPQLCQTMLSLEFGVMLSNLFFTVLIWSLPRSTSSSVASNPPTNNDAQDLSGHLRDWIQGKKTWHIDHLRDWTRGTKLGLSAIIFKQRKGCGKGILCPQCFSIL